MADNYNPAGSLQFEKTDKHRLGRIRGIWEDAMVREIPEANERAWNQGAEEVTDGTVDSDAEVRAVGDWYRRKLSEQAPAETTETTPTAPGIVDGVGAAADYGNRATDDFHTRFVPHLNAQANLEALEMGHSGSHHLSRFIGKVPDLASTDIKDLYKYYSDKISETA
jgi:hypothetical protein